MANNLILKVWKKWKSLSINKLKNFKIGGFVYLLVFIWLCKRNTFCLLFKYFNYNVKYLQKLYWELYLSAYV